MYKAGCEGVMTHMEVAGGYVKQNGSCQGGHEDAYEDGTDRVFRNVGI